MSMEKVMMLLPKCTNYGERVTGGKPDITQEDISGALAMAKPIGFASSDGARAYVRAFYLSDRTNYYQHNRFLSVFRVCMQMDLIQLWRSKGLDIPFDGYFQALSRVACLEAQRGAGKRVSVTNILHVFDCSSNDWYRKYKKDYDLRVLPMLSMYESIIETAMHNVNRD